jgi:hypothetical protein
MQLKNKTVITWRIFLIKKKISFLPLERRKLRFLFTFSPFCSLPLINLFHSNCVMLIISAVSLRLQFTPPKVAFHHLFCQTQKQRKIALPVDCAFVNQKSQQEQKMIVV